MRCLGETSFRGRHVFWCTFHAIKQNSFPQYQASLHREHRLIIACCFQHWQHLGICL